jgi:hypothetical protein
MPASTTVQYEKDGAGMIVAILATTFVLSAVMGALFYWQYSKVLLYVHTTLEEPEEPLAWEVRAHSPDECVGAALDWVAECEGIKSMCDMYVDRLIAMCMGSDERTGYCAVIDGSTTRFGHQECSVRGVRRNVDAESCSGAYRAIDAFCDSFEHGETPVESDE